MAVRAWYSEIVTALKQRDAQLCVAPEIKSVRDVSSGQDSKLIVPLHQCSRCSRHILVDEADGIIEYFPLSDFQNLIVRQARVILIQEHRV